jgi:hypothetical protein
LEQVARDGGGGLAKGVALVNAERQAQGQTPMVDQGDHFHALRCASPGFRKAPKRAATALDKAEQAQQEWEECKTQGRPAHSASARARAAWREAEEAMDAWRALDQAWKQTKQALRLITPEGELNTRHKAEAVLAESFAWECLGQKAYTGGMCSN